MQPAFLAPVFLGIAIIFVGAALRDALAAESKLTPARRTWIRIAMIFAAVAIGLVIIPTVFGSS
jgi:hypothetical protein